MKQQVYLLIYIEYIFITARIKWRVTFMNRDQ